MAAGNTYDVDKLLQRVAIKPVEEIKRRRRATGPKPVPALDPHVRDSYQTGEGRELTVPAWAAKETVSRLRASARYVSHELGEDVRLTIQQTERGDGRVTIRFRARPPMETGTRTHRNRRA